MRNERLERPATSLVRRGWGGHSDAGDVLRGRPLDTSKAGKVPFKDMEALRGAAGRAT